MTSYQNPWHDPVKPQYGPKCYTTSVKPTKYKGFLIYHRLDRVFDVVLDGVCVTQRAGFNGAKSYIDKHAAGDVLWA